MLIKEWEILTKQANRLQDSIFVPCTKRMLSEEDQITHLLEHGEWLGRHREGFLLMNCKNMNTELMVTKELQEHVKTAKEGERCTIRRIILE